MDEPSHKGFLKTFTGFTQDEFDRIFRKIAEGYETYKKERLNRKDRKKAIGAGRKFKLDLRERFLMLLVYYRLYITYTLAGFLLNWNQFALRRHKAAFQPLIKVDQKGDLRSLALKKYEIFGSKFRNRYKRYDTMTSIVGGFVNFRIMNSHNYSLRVCKSETGNSCAYP